MRLQAILLVCLMGCGGASTGSRAERAEASSESSSGSASAESADAVAVAPLEMGEPACAGLATVAEAQGCILETRAQLVVATVASNQADGAECIGLLCAFADRANQARAELERLRGRGLGPQHPEIIAAEASVADSERAWDQLRVQEIEALAAFGRALGEGEGDAEAVERARQAATAARLESPESTLALATSDVPERVRMAAATLDIAQRDVARLSGTFGERHPQLVAAQERVQACRAELLTALSQSLTEASANRE